MSIQVNTLSFALKAFAMARAYGYALTASSERSVVTRMVLIVGSDILGSIRLTHDGVQGKDYGGINKILLSPVCGSMIVESTIVITSEHYRADF